MDLDIIFNILKIAEEQNISKAADSLYITRSALNRQLLSIEKELGEPIFRRTNNALELTDVGKIYIEFAKVMRDLYREKFRVINDYLGSGKGSIRLGITAGHMNMILEPLLASFHQQYPQISISLSISNSLEQQSLLRAGKIDIAIMCAPEINNTFSWELLDKTEILIYVPPKHPKAELGVRGDDGLYRQCDLSWFEDDFWGMEKIDSPIRQICDQIFITSGFKPRIFVENCNSRILRNLVSTNTCLCTTTEAYLKRDTNANAFGFSPRKYINYGVAWRKNYNLSSYETVFVDIIKTCYANWCTQQTDKCAVYQHKFLADTK